MPGCLISGLFGSFLIISSLVSSCYLLNSSKESTSISVPTKIVPTNILDNTIPCCENCSIDGEPSEN